MKNFSVKTADFDSLSISGEAPIVQSDLGTAPNQIPLNKDLGSLAYMNAPQIEDINVDTLELREIAAELSETAVDVFVYDTRKDSDGGAWRHRTSHTSWYNEELNTATRGSRREFPAVAVIVAESDKVTIYDGDDPDLSMWMVFNTGSGTLLNNNNTPINTNAVVGLNGIICAGSENSVGTGGLTIINLISDTGYRSNTYSSVYQGFSFRGTYNGNISHRNTNDVGFDGQSIHGGWIIHGTANDVAMTVLPNAPIDAETGLPIPTIAVATDGGYSIIKDDGTVVDGISSQNIHNKVEKIAFTDDNRVTYIGFDYNLSNRGRFIRVDDLISVDTTITTAADQTQNSSAFYGNSVSTDFTGNLNLNISVYNGESFIEGKDGNIMFGNVQNLFLIDENRSSPSKGMHAGISTDFNTGWMPGDIKLATLSDTKIEKIGHKNMLTDVTSWTDMSATHSVSGNQITVTDDAADSIAGRVYKGIATTIGEEYVVSYDKITVGGNSSIFASIDETYGTNLGGGKINSGSQSFTFTATTTTTYIILATQSSGGGSATFDNVSVVPVGEGELITNGTFDDGTTGWTAGTGWSISAGVATHDASSGAGDLDQSLDLIVGKSYTIILEITSSDATEFYFKTDDGDYVAIEGSPVGTHAYTFIADNESQNVGVRGSGNWDGSIDNISVRLAEDDRSVNNNGLQVFGEIDKSPVAPGADLVAYSGFSAENYLMQPYNSDLDFGTGDFCVMGWFKRNSNSTYHRIWNRSDDVNNHRVEFYTDTTSNVVNFYTRHNADYTTVQASLPLGVWTNIVAVRESGTLKIYNNGILADSTTGTIRDLTSENNAVLEIGKASFDPGKTFDGSIALFRISSTVPTDEQIAKIYRDEKPLFQDGAQATLYGTSDAVTALAYDDSENLLHVGTASGRSSFNGLKRVENTDVAVTTAISATEGLVIEQ